MLNDPRTPTAVNPSLYLQVL